VTEWKRIVFCFAYTVSFSHQLVINQFIYVYDYTLLPWFVLSWKLATTFPSTNNLKENKSFWFDDQKDRVLKSKKTL